MDFRLPELGEGVYEAEWIEWRVAPGDRVRRGQTLAEVMTDKATMDLPSPFSGTITRLAVEPGQMVAIGAVILSFDDGSARGEAAPEAADVSGSETNGESPRRATSAAAHVESAALAEPRGGGSAIVASPSVRRMARQLGLDLRRLRGTGPRGRVLLDDLAAELKTSESAAVQSTSRAGHGGPAMEYGRPGTRIPMRGLRRKVAEQMVRSYTTVPHYSYMDECDVTELVRLRESLKPRFEAAGLKLTFLPFVVQAVVAALKEVPIVNGSLDESGEEIILHDRYDVGVAVATRAGLIVPVIRGADRLDLAGICRELQRLSQDAREGHSKLDDLRGSTFTVTSIGSIGGLISTPIINAPELGIAGVGRVVRRPVYDESGQLHPADMLYLSFSFDHRVIDGATGVVFGNAVIRHLREPAALLLPERLGS